MDRTARCQCGAFQVITSGQPNFVNICHCQACQRRTGAPWAGNAYWPKANVRLEGSHKIFTRISDAGRKFNNHFCPDCGSTVCWTVELDANIYGVAPGAFNDPSFPAPSVSIWEKSMYPWAIPPAGVK